MYSTAEYKPENFFKEMDLLEKKFNLLELSMGMSSDYIQAAKNSATYLRIGSNIFGKRVRKFLILVFF